MSQIERRNRARRRSILSVSRASRRRLRRQVDERQFDLQRLDDAQAVLRFVEMCPQRVVARDQFRQRLAELGNSSLPRSSSLKDSLNAQLASSPTGADNQTSVCGSVSGTSREAPLQQGCRRRCALCGTSAAARRLPGEYRRLAIPRCFPRTRSQCASISAGEWAVVRKQGKPSRMYTPLRRMW